MAFWIMYVYIVAVCQPAVPGSFDNLLGFSTIPHRPFQVMRLGSLQGEVSVRFSTEDVSAKSGERFHKLHT